MGSGGTNQKTWTRRTGKTSYWLQACLLPRGHQEAAGAGAGRGFDLPAVIRQELPQGSEKKKGAVSCWGCPGESRASPPRGPLLFVTLISRGSWGNQGCPENSPSTKKVEGGRVSKTRLRPGRCEKEKGSASKMYTSLLQRALCPQHWGPSHAKPWLLEVLTPSCWPWGLGESAEDSGIQVAPWAHPGSGTGHPGKEDRGNLYQTQICDTAQ